MQFLQHKMCNIRPAYFHRYFFLMQFLSMLVTACKRPVCKVSRPDNGPFQPAVFNVLFLDSMIFKCFFQKEWNDNVFEDERRLFQRRFTIAVA